MIVLYSLLLLVGLTVSAPWWVLRLLTTERYREGLRQRLGSVPEALRAFVAGKRVIWIHAVSVGETLAASRLVRELEAALGDGWCVVVSTTTRTGQALAKERFGSRFGVERVFYYPLDLAFAVRAYLDALRPGVLLLMESEVWPRMLHECRRMGTPVVVVNARVSDRSFARGMRVRAVWGWVLREVSLWLAQSDEDARRLVAMGAVASSVKVGGNLKYDVLAPKQSRVAELIKEAAAGRPIVVAGSTCEDAGANWEESLAIQAWELGPRKQFGALLVLAPRHVERFFLAESIVMEFAYAKASEWEQAEVETPLIAKNAMNGAPNELQGATGRLEIVLLDTIGDLAAVYGIADVAFVGGSLVKRGGHSPLEPAQFGVPVVMGPSYENFRDVVERMRAEDAICIVGVTEALRENGQCGDLSTAAARSAASGRDDTSLVEDLGQALMQLLTDREAALAMGERGRQVFEAQQGATARAVDAIVAMVKP